jgi:hypothetical protein
MLNNFLKIFVFSRFFRFPLHAHSQKIRKMQNVQKRYTEMRAFLRICNESIN